MKVIDRYLLVDLFKLLFALMLVVSLLMGSLMFVKLLEKVALGNMNPTVVFPLMGYQVVRYLARTMPAAFFLSMLLVVGRMYRDNEMTALAACGIGPGRVYRSVFIALFPAVALTAWMAIWLQPWASVQIENIKLEQQKEGVELALIQPGRFNEYSAGDLVFYVEEVDQERGEMRNLFIQNREQGEVGLVTAKRGVHDFDVSTGDHFLTLYDGQRYEGTPGQGDFRIAMFDSYTLRIAESASKRRDDRKGKSSQELFRSENVVDQAEFWERVSFPVSLVTLALLAIPLSRSLPRQTLYGRLLFAFLVYFAYINLSGVSVSWMKKQVTPEWMGIWWVQVLLILLALLLAGYDSTGMRRMLKRLRRGNS